MTVPPHAQTEFEREWHRLAGWVQRQPGCLRQTLAVEAGAESTYVITSDWIDAATYEQFERSSRQDDETAGLRRLRTSVRMTVLTIVEHKER